MAADPQASQNVLNIPSFEEASFLEAAGSPFSSFGQAYQNMLPVEPSPHQTQDPAASANDDHREIPQGQGCLDTLLCPASIDKLLGDVDHDVPFPDMDFSGTWDMGMQMHPHFFVPQPVDEMPPIPEVMPGVDVPLSSTMMPLRDLTVAEMPPNVTVTLKGRRTQQHASLGHLTKVMRRLNDVDEQFPRTSQSVAELEPSAAQEAAHEPPGPKPQRRRPSASQERHLRQQDKGARAEQPRAPVVRLRAAADITGTLPVPQPHNRGARAEEPPAAAPEPVQRKLRRKGDIPERLAAILENERSPSNSEDSNEKTERTGSQQDASPSVVVGCRLSRAACRAQGALHQLTEEEVMEVEAELGPDSTEEERTAAYKRARNRSAARKTRRRKVDAVQEMQEQVQILGQQNRNLISELNSLIAQVELSSRENATLKGLLRYLQLQPGAAKATPSLADLEALRNDMVASPDSSAAAAAVLPAGSPAAQDRAEPAAQDPAPNRARWDRAQTLETARLSDSEAQEVAAAALAANEGNVSAALSHLVVKALGSKPAK